LTHARWPDLLAGVVLAAIFLQSASSIIHQARAELRAQRAPPAVDFITHSRHQGRRV
jgi:Co/Zn/Cd efflux system component